MKFPDWLRVYGDQSFRGKCPHESVEQITFFHRLRREYPDTYGVIAIHARTEGDRSHAQTVRYKAEGLTPGCADIIIPSSKPFVCEMKRMDHTKSEFQNMQLVYLQAAHSAGAFVCVALGYLGAWSAFEDWKRSQ